MGGGVAGALPGYYAGGALGGLVSTLSKGRIDPYTAKHVGGRIGATLGATAGEVLADRARIRSEYDAEGNRIKKGDK